MPNPDKRQLETGRLLFAQSCDFIAGAASVEALPKPRTTEIAFAGRSNVGKSSLINALTGRNSLARVSRTPGRTQQINFFLLGGALTLVDLPGYGYAKVAKHKVADWSELTIQYLKGRQRLRRVMVMIDSRHGLKDSDKALFDLLDEAAVSYQVVLTKCDEISEGATKARVAEITGQLLKHVAAHPEIAPTSAREGTGIPALRAELAALAK